VHDTRTPGGAAEAACRLLEGLWDVGQQPDVGRILGETGVKDAADVAQVLAVDQWRRWQAGERVPVETYLERFPPIAAEPDAALELIYGELLVREELGEHPTDDEYLSRFPQWADGLRQQLQLHRKIDECTLGSHVQVGSRDKTLPAGPRAAAGRLPKPPQVPGYQITGVLGRGAMGVVYQALHLRLGRTVALKIVLAGGHASATDLVRFLSEAELAARLQHPNIVQIYDIGNHQGLPYFTLEHVDRGTLAKFLAGKPLDARASADFVKTLAVAVEHAHQHGVVHRDLKPANILLQSKSESRNSKSETAGPDFGFRISDFEPKIADFGLAKLVGVGPGLTTTGTTLGTPSYMAPEQATGRHTEVGPAADVYALGAILYEMLTGRPPFVGATSMDTLAQVLNQEPVPPARFQPGVPRDLDTVCLQCLRKVPAKRYASAQALADDLVRFLEGRPVEARRTSSLERGWRWCRRNPALASLSAALALLVLAIAVASTIAASSMRRQRDDARALADALEVEQGNLRDEQANTLGQLRRAEEAERQRDLELGRSLLSEGIATQRSGQRGQRFRSLDLLAQAAKKLGAHPEGMKLIPELRDQAIAAMGLTDVRPLWRRELGTQKCMHCDSRMKRYAVLDIHTGQTTVYRMEDGRKLLDLPAPEIAIWHAVLKFSPDGQQLVIQYALRGEANQAVLVRVFHLDRKEPVFDRRMRGSADGSTIHPNGRWLVFPPTDGGLAVWDLVEKREVRRLPVAFVPFTVCVDARGERLAVNDAGHPLVKIFDLKTGRELASWNSQVGSAAMAWSADGRLLAVGHHDGRTFVWDVDRGRLASVLQGHTNRVTYCQFAHNGYLLATSSWDFTTRLWDASSGEALVSTPGEIFQLSADDDRLFSHENNQLVLSELSHGQVLRRFNPGLVGNRLADDQFHLGYSTAFSPDGRLLAVGGPDGARLLNAATGQELEHLKGKLVGSVLFHPDGRSLITCGEGALTRWPILSDRDLAPGQVRLGPPQLLRQLPQTASYAAWMPGHAKVVTASHTGQLQIIDLAHPDPADGRPVAIDLKNYRAMSLGVTPDGRWATMGCWRDRQLPVFDLARRRLERALPPSDGTGWAETNATFSPDGRWLAWYCQGTTRNGYYFHRAGTWERKMFIPVQGLRGWAAPVYTPDSRLMALSISPERILLADAATGRPITHLATHEPLMPAPLTFSPDASRLIAFTNKKTLLSWDLHRIREQLATLGIEAPELR
jgi:serine/threonine protein kinase/WD40 repeat protein